MKLRRKRDGDEVNDQYPRTGPRSAEAALERAQVDAEEASRQQEEIHLRVIERRRDYFAPDLEAVMQSNRRDT